MERATPEEIAEFLEETEVPVRKRRRRTTEQEVDWTELARRKRALKRHRPTIE